MIGMRRDEVRCGADAEADGDRGKGNCLLPFLPRAWWMVILRVRVRVGPG
jgi:hypothetical protein